MICRGARAQAFKIEVNEILRGAAFLFTSRPLVIDIFHDKHISGGSQAIKSKGLLPLHQQTHSTTNRIHGYRPYQHQSWGCFV